MHDFTLLMLLLAKASTAKVAAARQAMMQSIAALMLAFFGQSIVSSFAPHSSAA